MKSRKASAPAQEVAGAALSPEADLFLNLLSAALLEHALSTCSVDAPERSCSPQEADASANPEETNRESTDRRAGPVGPDR